MQVLIAFAEIIRRTAHALLKTSGERIMSISTIVMFPGQGGYSPQHWNTIRRKAELEPVLQEMNEVTLVEAGIDLINMPEEDRDAQELSRTDPTRLQILIHASNVLTGSWLKVNRHANGDVAAGHSFGEIAALWFAGVLSAADSMRVVCARNAAMARHQPNGGRMVAVGLPEERAHALLTLLGCGDALAVAGRNAQDRSVLSGSPDVVEQAQALLKSMGVAALPVPSPWAFHHPSLQAAANDFRDSMAKITWGDLHIPVYSPVLGRYYRDGEDFGLALAQHLTEPFVFDKAVAQLTATGQGRVFDAGAGGVITALCTRLVDGTGWTVSGVDLTAQSNSSPNGTPFLLDSDQEWLVRVLSGDFSVEKVAAQPLHALSEYWSREADGVFSALAKNMRAVFDATDDNSVSDIVDDAAEQPGFASSVGGAGLSEDEVVQRLAVLYAEALEYPVEVFTEDLGVQLEADLGVDSVKQTDLLARVAEEFGMPVPGEGFSVAGYPTFGSVVALVRETTSASGAVPSAPLTHASSVGGAGLSEGEVVQRLAVLYAEALEYPVEVFTEDLGVQLEADLGVDSVKQTDLLARVAEEFGMPVPGEGFSVAGYPTFGSVVALVRETTSASQGTDTQLASKVVSA
ncbi:acyltransferase domain-containing protein [Kocuria soli]|uniref:acyltransferase domain-containing protein n=1 Tax=Kocuria soli TaxID=2485125 RepID=UPI0013152D35|nr:acyltransferase domain-containing protein [Kocuria soli]